MSAEHLQQEFEKFLRHARALLDGGTLHALRDLVQFSFPLASIRLKQLLVRDQCLATLVLTPSEEPLWGQACLMVLKAWHAEMRVYALPHHVYHVDLPTRYSYMDIHAAFHDLPYLPKP